MKTAVKTTRLYQLPVGAQFVFPYKSHEVIYRVNKQTGDRTNISIIRALGTTKDEAITIDGNFLSNIDVIQK